MTRKLLIDAAHPEETRVVVVAGNRVEEFDFETAAKKQLKGNIYLAKVTRVEPSLQAAFVEYGGNRHGFLAFSEIHPDYYQIPIEDRLALLAEEAAAEDEEDELEDREASDLGDGNSRHDEALDEEAQAASSPEELSLEAQRAAESALLIDTAANGDASPTPEPGGEAGDSEDVSVTEPAERQAESASSAPAMEATGLRHDEIAAPADTSFSEPEAALGDELPAAEPQGGGPVEMPPIEAPPEEVGAQDAMEELPRRKRRPVRRYKIQEVIRRRQILLVQVVKEERGNKGAALTTYLSLAGRYCVLMPNTDRGGGISRKITSGADRKRLKDIAVDLEVPDGMGLIVRTAGANRTKAELKRDFEYLLRLWESVRELTLKSTAPALVYEEGNLVKRSIRDLYGRDIDEVLVEGEEAYKEAKAFMKMLTPSHTKNVQPYGDKLPLFQRYQVETQLDSLFSPRVDLKSGGYIVINATEALVAIDVNSGKATREHSIEETALLTNMEAAEEVARQLRLRDLAGLIVIDFIDMEEHRHDRQVERCLKEALKTDRARIQVGRISAFGLLEMSRQRLRASVLEGSTLICEHCEGAGRVPSVETMALRILRAIEEEGVRARMDAAEVKAPSDVALYLLNYKRGALRQIEERFGLPCYIEAAPEMHAGHFTIERAPEGLIAWKPATPVVNPESAYVEEVIEEEPAIEDEAEELAEEATQETLDGEGAGRADRDGGRRGRRRRRRGRRGEERGMRESQAPSLPGTEAELEETAEPGSSPEDEGSAARQETQGEEHRRRRRGRRGGRRNRRRDRPDLAQGDDVNGASARTADDDEMTESESAALAFAPLEDVPAAAGAAPSSDEEPAPAPWGESERSIEIEMPEPLAPAASRGNGHEDSPPTEQSPPATSALHAPLPDEEDTDTDRPRRKGWWQRKLFG